MTTSTTAQPPASAPLLDLPALVVAVRRRRRLWGSMALLGLLAGAALAVLMPPPPTAVTKVLVAHQEDQPNDPGTLIRTDVALLHTTRIADKALQALKSPEKPEDFMADYAGLGLTNNVLQITVTGASDAEAVARAKALADAFVADHVRRIREAANAEAQALLDQRDRLQDELAQVNKSIGEQSADGGPDASANLESLYARRAELTSRISDFGQRAEEAQVGTPQLVAGTQIVDAPRAVRHSLPKAAATDAAIGLVLGLALGLAVAAVGTVVADRPVLRRDIAANLGASVIAELPRGPGRRWRRRRTRAARERLAVSLARTVRGSAEPVSLLELGCARGASVIALDLAGALAADGPVVVVDALPGQQLAGRRRPRPGDPTVVSAADAEAVRRDERAGAVRDGEHAGAVPHAGRAAGVPHGERTDAMSRGGPAGVVSHGEHAEAVSRGEHARAVRHGERTDAASHGERADAVSHGEHTGVVPHRDHTEAPSHSDHTTRAPHGAYAEAVPDGDRAATAPHGKHGNHDNRPTPTPHHPRRLGVGSVAPGTAWADLRYLGTRTVLVVRAGHGSAAWLHTVARQLADQGVPVIGVVLIDPDPRDRTDGTLWDGARGRAALRNGAGRQWTERLPVWAAARVPDSDQEAR